MSKSTLFFMEMLVSLEEDISESEGMDYSKGWMASYLADLLIRGKTLNSLTSINVVSDEAVIMKLAGLQKQIKNLWSRAEEEGVVPFRDIEGWIESVLSMRARYAENDTCPIPALGPHEGSTWLEKLDVAEKKYVEWSNEKADLIHGEVDILEVGRKLGLSTKFTLPRRISTMKAHSKEELKEILQANEICSDLISHVSVLTRLEEIMRVYPDSALLNEDFDKWHAAQQEGDSALSSFIEDPVGKEDELLNQLINHPEQTQKDYEIAGKAQAKQWYEQVKNLPCDDEEREALNEEAVRAFENESDGKAESGMPAWKLWAIVFVISVVAAGLLASLGVPNGGILGGVVAFVSGVGFIGSVLLLTFRKIVGPSVAKEH